ncbi:peptide-methionine (R)-S-oxide reductase MsrB [Synechocystis sp. LEGE 06083]|uniref:peptide-methionine (R)-S-oxide reductase MsrB n=1 Tax=Synechocystis sp. LEGE 06083 TaxID=915336 RepID=UPI00187E436C|nr:peptide-methionine (R)-S-oxide reductase MsrB [Synechocystis sp. LEGE 06083]MBE9194311.1 peptide-methionine (R)-S-oxide reductase MsrB [Synechocystis sp. LEGE 06083]
MKRRYLLEVGTASLGGIWLSQYLGSAQSKQQQPLPMTKTQETFPINKTDAEWQAQLSPEAYKVLRKHGTERAGSSPLDKNYKAGIYECAGCGTPMFTSETKFDSGTGWPSFYQPIEGAVGYTTDRSFFMTRTEVHCSQCGGHLGHVFDDGPQPTGKRYCMNGVSLKFVPA